MLFALAPIAGAQGMDDLGVGLGDPSDSAAVEDLTALTLDELFNLDIVQLNVLGGHTHYAGEIMFGYEYMFSSSGGYKDGSSNVSDARILGSGVFGNIHTKMTMEMHMFKAMYAPSDRWTFAAMLHYSAMEMDHLDVGGMAFSTKSEGVGDLKLMSLYTIFGDIHEGGSRLILNTGLSIPTGSVKQNYVMGGTWNRLEYRMQTGTGTWDPSVGLTYLYDQGNFSSGVQGMATFRFGNNESGYRFGNKYSLTAWGAYSVTDWLAPYIRVEGNLRGNIKGSDPALNPASNPESVPSLQGGTEINLILGTSLYAGDGFLKGNRLTLEGGMPVYQHLSGPQLSTEWFVRAGWSISF